MTTPTPDERIKEIRERLDENGMAHPDLIYHGSHRKDIEFLVAELEAKEAEINRLKADIENMAWNLGGCSTYALGYGLDEGHAKELARPALEDVLKLALKYRASRQALDKIVHELGVPNKDYPAPVANAYEIAMEALSPSSGEVKDISEALGGKTMTMEELAADRLRLINENLALKHSLDEARRKP